MRHDEPTDDDDDGAASSHYANRHIPALLALPQSSTAASATAAGVQIVDNGSLLTAENFRNETLSLQRPVLVTDTPESIGMKLPHKNKRHGNNKASKHTQNMTVRDIADFVGHNTPVHAIDVEFQEELEGWSFADLIEYFEDEERIRCFNRSNSNSSSQQQASTEAAAAATTQRSALSRRPQRKAAQQVSKRIVERHRVINQISYEFSATPLAPHVRSPAFVRELDWIDTVWPGRGSQQQERANDDTTNNDTSTSPYPAVQYYCLTSAAGCYTDFHIDFGGTSVWYHVLNGAKDFVLIVPTAENLQIYEQWLCSSNQACTFLPNLISHGVVRIQLQQDQTMIIPAGWPHAVYTPTDSLVFGGNFLHGLDMQMQLSVYAIEVRSKVLERFRFPFFLQLQYYAAGVYLHKLRQGTVCAREVKELSALLVALTGWWGMHSQQDEARSGGGGGTTVTIVDAAAHAARQHGYDTFDQLLEALKGEHERVLRDGISKNTSSLSIARPPPPTSPPPVSPTGPRKIRLKLGGSSSKKAVGGGVVADSSKETVPEKKVEKKKIRLTLSSSRTSSGSVSRPPPPPPKQNEANDDAAFSIKLSAGSKRGDPVPGDVPVVRTNPREDMSSLFDERELMKDEEWVPPASLLEAEQTSSADGALVLDGPNKRSLAKKSSSSSGRGAKKVKKTSSTSARQRLLKKVR